MKLYAYLLTWMFVWLSLPIFAIQDTLFSQKIQHQFLNRVQKYPQEKVYLHTDKDHYEVRDTIWFRAYLTNIYNNIPSNLSRFVYVELRDKQDHLRQRVKVPVRNSMFFGYIPLSDKLAQGDYVLRAYSYWMQNEGDDYIFRKKIRLINPYSSLVQTSMTYEKSGDQYVVKLHLYNSRNVAYDRMAVEIIQDGKVREMRTDNQGNIQLELDSLHFGKKITLRFRSPFKYEHFLFLPDPRKDFVVSFLPEGGHLLEGCNQTIGIKAIGQDGLSREVYGSVMNAEGEKVAEIQTIHKGMGKFNLQIEPGQQYHALLAMKGGEQKRFDLPQPMKVGVGIQVNMELDSIHFVVKSTANFPKINDLYLLVHSKGKPYFCIPVKSFPEGKLAQKDLPPGIVHLVLIDTQNEVYSERLCFVHHKKQTELNLTWNKPTYRPRERVEMDLQILTDSLLTKKGSFSVAITDDEQVERNQGQDHIVSYLLLSSDLKGHIEEPAFYFKDTHPKTLVLLDLLLMTQGWSRFRLPNFLEKKYDSFAYFMERGQVIVGKILGFRKSDVSRVNLVLRSNLGWNGFLGRKVELNPDGSFMIDDIVFPDSTKFSLHASNRNNKAGVRIYKMRIEKDTFMKPSVKIPFNPNISMAEDDFYKRYSKDYFYENGMKVYVLDELFLEKEMKRSTELYYEKNADFSMNEEQVKELQHLDMRSILQRIPGITIIRDTIYYMNDSIVLLVNDMIESLEYVERLRVPEDIVSINLVTPLASRTFLGERGNNGLIAITTPIEYVPSPPRNIHSFSLLGYQKRAEFYMPRYDVDAVKKQRAYISDRRPTIYWNPKIETDQEGKAKFEFYTSDSFGPYTVVVEGQLEDGSVYRKEAKIRIKSF